MPHFKFAYWSVSGEMLEPEGSFEDAIFCPVEWNVHDVKRELNERYRKQNKLVNKIVPICMEVRDLEITWEQFKKGTLTA